MKKLTPKQKKIAAAVAAGGVLALFVLIRGKGGGSATQDATANPATGSGLPADYGAAGGTFADNGASAGQLSSQISDLTGSFGSALTQLQETFTGQLSDQQKALAASNDRFAQQMADLASRTAPSSAPGPAGDAGQPSGNAGSGSLAAGANTPAARPPITSTAAAVAALKAGGKAPSNEFVQDSGPRKGQAYTVIQKNGHSYRRYASGPPVLIK